MLRAVWRAEPVSAAVHCAAIRRRIFANSCRPPRCRWHPRRVRRARRRACHTDRRLHPTCSLAFATACGEVRASHAPRRMQWQMRVSMSDAAAYPCGTLDVSLGALVGGASGIEEVCTSLQKCADESQRSAQPQRLAQLAKQLATLLSDAAAEHGSFV
eukprot:TRINITY_DN2166_c0_g1_i1.p2 TRINITY_DN2166_c0_g1~~TRINITY_DN2166_c0_g1_i1.p2  ORF type:complete len:158 (-),score=16.00 TRINITY_DN2166_c0_g1_i1:43-516(-)